MSDEQEPQRRGWRRAFWAGPMLFLYLVMHGTASAASIWVLAQCRQGRVKPPLFVEIAAGYTVVSSVTIGLGMLGGVLSGLFSERKRPS